MDSLENLTLNAVAARQAAEPLPRKVGRFPAAANVRLPPAGEPFDDGSWPTKLRGSGTDRRRSRGVCRIRVVEYRLAECPGESCRLATTLLDPGAFPARELAGVYHERWEIENAYDEVKTHLLGPGAALRSKTPELVLQEIVVRRNAPRWIRMMKDCGIE